MFAANRGVLDKVAGGFTVSDTAAVIEAKLTALGADVANIKSIVATDTPVKVSEAQFAANRGVLDKVAGGFIVADTAAVIEAKLTALGADVANIKSIVATDAPVKVSEAVFAANRGVLDKVAGGFIVADTAAVIEAKLAALGADVAHIKSIVATDTPPTVPIAQFNSFGALLNKLSGGFSISDTAANIGAALTALVADNGHLATITATGGPLTVSAAAFLADETTLNKVTNGVEIADTTTHFAADALPDPRRFRPR